MSMKAVKCGCYDSGDCRNAMKCEYKIKGNKMTVEELKELLSNFSNASIVCVEDWSIGSCLPIETVRGQVEKETGKFLVRLDVQGGPCS